MLCRRAGPSRWSPSLIYQPPSGSLAQVPRRADGPRDHSGTGVASSPTEPSKLASSFPEHTYTETSSKSATNFSRAFCLAAMSSSLNFLRLAASSLGMTTLSLASTDGSTTERTRWNR